MCRRRGYCSCRDCGTGKESNCCNKHASCADWASRGECKKNPEWMLLNCQLSCRVCKTDSNPSKPSTATSKSCSSNGMTNEQRQKFLDMHNNYRSMVAKGQAKDAYGGNAPRAARMKKMIYDCAIEESAMRHAKRCVFVHSPAHTRENLGENLYYTSELRLDKIKAAEQGIKACDELAQYGVGQQNVLTKQLWSRPNTQIGHYTQMVWQDTYKLGCHVEWYSSMTYVVCQYGPKGNWLGNLIYDIGNSCTTDGDCKCDNCKCSKEEALCIVQ
ncbi:hypothetical protein Aduo_005344 [Ancylostoma duodenale]